MSSVALSRSLCLGIAALRATTRATAGRLAREGGQTAAVGYPPNEVSRRRRALRAVRVSPRLQLKAKVRPTDNGLRGQEERGGVSGELVSTETAALFFRRLRRRDSPRKRRWPLKVGRGHKRTRPACIPRPRSGRPQGGLPGVQRRLLAFEGVVSRTTPRGSRGGDRFSREE